MADFLDRLRGGSYNGVPFKVALDERSGGRRLAVHEFARSEASLVEDLGRVTRRQRVTAYVAGDASSATAEALAAILDAPGPGLLVLPLGVAGLAHVEDFGRAFFKDRLGYIAFDITFVMAGSASVPAIGLGNLATVFEAGVGAAASALGGLFS